MKLRSLLVLAVLAVALTGCSASSSPDGTDPGSDPTNVEDSQGDGSPAAEPWSECPGIVERLNGNEQDPTVYEQLEPSEFAVSEVGADVLAGACVIRVTVNSDPITWAILPGDGALADAISTSLTSSGFTPSGQSLFGNSSTGVGVLVQAFGSGADLDAFLVYSTAFSSIDEPIVYLGSFAL